MNEREIFILEIVNQQHLVRRDDLKNRLHNEGFSDGMADANGLKDQGLLKFVDSVGSPCYTITQSGIRALKENQF